MTRERDEAIDRLVGEYRLNNGRGVITQWLSCSYDGAPHYQMDLALMAEVSEVAKSRLATVPGLVKLDDEARPLMHYAFCVLALDFDIDALDQVLASLVVEEETWRVRW